HHPPVLFTDLTRRRLPPAAEPPAHDLPEVRSRRRDHETHRGGLVIGDRTKVVVEQRERIAVVLERDTQRRAHVSDRLIGVHAYTCRNRVVHTPHPTATRAIERALRYDRQLDAA